MDYEEEQVASRIGSRSDRKQARPSSDLEATAAAAVSEKRVVIGEVPTDNTSRRSFRDNVSIARPRHNHQHHRPPVQVPQANKELQLDSRSIEEDSEEDEVVEEEEEVGAREVEESETEVEESLEVSARIEDQPTIAAATHSAPIVAQSQDTIFNQNPSSLSIAKLAMSSNKSTFVSPTFNLDKENYQSIVPLSQNLEAPHEGRSLAPPRPVVDEISITNFKPKRMAKPIDLNASLDLSGLTFEVNP